MSEEIASADALLTENAELRAQVKALRMLDQLDQALSSMSVTEIDSARARIDSALVPQLAKMLALCLVKDDGAFYNVVTWALGSAEPLGTMELILQRTEGKTPTQLRIEAEADAAALRQALDDRHICANCGGKGSYWTDIGGEAEHEVCDCWIRADHVLYHEEHPGTALLAELEAARAVVAAARTGFGTEEDIKRAHAFDPNLLTARIRAYDEAMKAREE